VAKPLELHVSGSHPPRFQGGVPLFRLRWFGPGFMLLALLISPVDAGAQTLSLGSGRSIFVKPFNGGTAMVTGPEGFTFYGFVSDGGVRAFTQCASPACTPGHNRDVGGNVRGQ
jgi:hypothetical protein